MGALGGRSRSAPRREGRPRAGARRGAALVVLAAVAVVVGLLAGASHDDSARQLAERFATAWAHRDYAAMYGVVDPATRHQLRAARFAAAYRRADATATATSSRVGRARGPRSGAFEVPAVVRTRIFGTISAPLRVPVLGHGAAARVQWSRALLFPGLGRGEALRRTTSLPPRASLLTREGAVLAEGAVGAGTSGQRPSPLGPAATAISGLVGPIPAKRATELYALGYPRDGKVGISGLERVFEAQLSGTPGGELSAGTRRIASTNEHAGAPVRTTISGRLQRTAVAALGSREGAIAIIRPATGEILALAGIPLSGLQPPGSTFKIITLTGVLETGLATPRTRFPVRTAATLSGVSLQNANGESCGGTLAAAFAQSCNSVFAPLGARLGAARLVDVARRFGFGEPTGITGAATSSIPPASRIRDDLAVGSTAIGQGEVEATALQMATVAATIAMRGRRPRPTLAAGAVRPAARATTPEVAHTVERLMLGVVRRGTGRPAAIHGVAVAGKTGTAELRQTAGPCHDSGQGSGGCDSSSGDPRNTDAWFAAFAPAGRPRIAVGVLLVGAGAGAETAAPLARQLLLAALH